MFKIDYQKNTTNIIKMTNKETKPKYKKKRISYCLKCARKTKNENIEGVALENKMGQQRSTCVVCDSKKSTFLKPIKLIKSNKKQK